MRSILNEENFEIWLKLLALLNLAFGLILILFPNEAASFFQFTTQPSSLFVQFSGIVCFVFAIGYFIASLWPSKHWGIIFIAFMLRLFLLLLLTKGFLASEISARGFAFIAAYLIVGVFAFVYILLDAYAQNTKEESAPKQFYELMKYVRTNDGKALLDMSQNQDVLLVFVRHFGCTFCRETVSELAKLESTIQEKKLTPVFVHMSDQAFADDFFSRYFNHPVQHISDPARALYRSLGLKRGTLGQLFGLKVVLRGFWAGVFKGHGLGGFEGDVLQLGGYFILSKGQVVFEHKTRGAADFFRPDLLPQR